MAITESITKTVLGNLAQLSWACGKCSMMSECEERGLPNKPSEFESLYCKSMIVAAIMDQTNEPFIVPFPKDN